MLTATMKEPKVWDESPPTRATGPWESPRPNLEIAALDIFFLHLALVLLGMTYAWAALINKGPTGSTAAGTVDWALVPVVVDRTVTQHVDTARLAASRAGAMTAGRFRW